MSSAPQTTVDPISQRSWEPACQLVFAGVFLYGIYLRWLLPRIPFAEPDTWGYLSPAVTDSLGEGFQLVYGRHHIYPLFLAAILRFDPCVEAVAFVQHLLGAAATLLLWGAWRIMANLFTSKDLRLAHWTLGLILVTLVHLNPVCMFFEHSLLPESVFSFTCALFVYLLVRFIITPAQCQYVSLLTGSALAVVSGLLYFIKPQWGLGVFLGFAALIVASRPLRIPFSARVLAVVGSVAAVILLGYWPYQQLSRRDPAAHTFGPMTVFYCNAHLTLIELHRDEDLPNPPFPRELVAGMRKRISEEIDGSASNSSVAQEYPVLGYNPDRLFYGEAAKFAADFAQGNHELLRTFYTRYATRVLLKHPWLLTEKSLSQLKLFYGWSAERYPTAGVDAVVSLQQTRRACEGMNRTALAELEWGRQYLQVLDLDHGTYPYVTPFRSYRAIAAIANGCYPLAVLATLASIGFVLYRSPQCSTNPLLLLAILPLLNLAPSLTASVVHSLEIVRYIENQLVLTAFSQAAMISLCTLLLLERKGAAE